MSDRQMNREALIRKIRWVDSEITPEVAEAILDALLEQLEPAGWTLRYPAQERSKDCLNCGKPGIEHRGPLYSCWPDRAST